MATNDAELRQIPGGSWQNGQWYSDATVLNPAKKVSKGGKSYHLAYITDEEARVLDKENKGSYFSAQKGGKASGEGVAGEAPLEWVSEPSHAKSRLVYINDAGASKLKKLDLHGSGVDKKDHFGPLEIPSYQGDGGGGTGGFGGGGGGGGWGAAMGEGGYNSTAPGLGGFNGYTGSYGATTGDLGGFNQASTPGGYAGMAAGYGDGFGFAQPDFSSFQSYDALAPSMMGDMARMAVPGPSFGDSGLGMGLADNFVADPETEDREKRKMMKTLLSPVTNAITNETLGPLGALASNTVNSVLGLQTQTDTAKNMLGNIAGMLGYAVGGPIGGLAGRYGASKLGNPTGPARGSNPDGGGSTGIDWGALAGGLAGMYQANQASKAIKAAQQGTMGSVQQQLSDMFGPNSAYAQQLRQELERRDAAGGRRSQYGPREVELQAKLAQMQAQAAPGMINAAMNQQQAAMQSAQLRQAQKNAMFNNMLQIGRGSGLFDMAGNKMAEYGQQLSDMYGNGGWGTGNAYGNEDPGLYL